MQVSVETTSGLERKMTVQVPQDRVEKEVQSRLQQLARTTKIKGFRPGKVPMKIVASRFGGEVRQEVLGEVIQSSFYAAVAQENLKPAGVPSIDTTAVEAGKDIEFTATFEVMPEVELADVSGIKLDKPVATITDADVDKMLDTLRKQHSNWTAVERAAQDGDRLKIDFKGTIDGEDFAGNEGKDMPVTLGGKRMIAGFEEGLVGAKTGDELTLDLQFPDDYGNKDVAGKPAQFAVKVNSVEAPELAEIDDEFAKTFGVDGGVDALRQEIRQNMERELQQALHGKIKQQVMDKLVELNELDVPKALIENESKALLEQMRQQMYQPQGKGVDLDPSMFAEQAKRRVTLGLILSDLIKSNELQASQEQVREQVEKLAASYESPEEVIKYYYGDRNRLAEVESLVLEDRVVDWVLERADVTEVESSFDEIMNRGQ